MKLQERRRCLRCPSGWAYPSHVAPLLPPALRKAGFHKLCADCMDLAIGKLAGEGIAR